jgi:hypothetical protein
MVPNSLRFAKGPADLPCTPNAADFCHSSLIMICDCVLYAGATEALTATDDVKDPAHEPLREFLVQAIDALAMSVDTGLHPRHAWSHVRDHIHAQMIRAELGHGFGPTASGMSEQSQEPGSTHD